MRARLMALAALVACGKSEPDKKVVAVAPPPPAPVKRDVKPLPSTGMLCFGGGTAPAWLWKTDGTKEKYLDAARLVVAQDGTVWQIVSIDAVTNDVLLSISQPGTDVPLKHSGGGAFPSPSGSVLSIGPTGTAQVFRNGAWRKLDKSATIEASSVSVALEHQGAWWLQSSAFVYHEVGDELQEVPFTTDHNIQASGLVEQNDELFLLYGENQDRRFPLLMSRITTIGSVSDERQHIGATSGTTHVRIVTNAAANWAAYARGDERAPVHASVGGKVMTVVDKALTVLAIDGHDRVWYQDGDGVVAVAPDGKQQRYAKASHDMFRLANEPRCAVLGKGFEQLPAP